MSDIDITERLRHEDLFNLGTDHEYQLEVAGRAADEIETLRADRDRIAEVQAGHAREIERLRTRLDEALGARDHFRAAVDRAQKCFGTIDRLRKHISKQNASIAELGAELERLRPLKEAAFNYEELKSCQAGIAPLLFAASEYATRALNEKADNLTWDSITEENSSVDCVVTDEGVFWKPGEDET